MKKDLVQLYKNKSAEKESSYKEISKPMSYIQASKNNCMNQAKKNGVNSNKNAGSNRYTKLIQEFYTVSVEKISIGESVPYELPMFYSLDYEEQIISSMDKRIHIIKRHLIKADDESLALDWRNIGRDINGALVKYGGNYRYNKRG